MKSRFVRNTVFGSATALSTTLGSFLISLVVSRLLGVAQSGTYTFAIWIVSTAATLTGIGIPFTMSRFLPEISTQSGQESALQVARLMLPLATAANLLPVIGFTLYALYLVVVGPVHAAHVAAGSLGDPVLCLLIGAACSILAIANYARGFLRGMQSMDRVALLNTVAALIQIPMIALGTILFGIRGAVGGYAIGALAPLFAYADLRRVKPYAAPGVLRRIFIYTRFRWASEISAIFVFSRIEVFFLSLTWHPHLIGLFAAAMTLANLASQGPLMLTWGLLPRFSEQFGMQDTDSLRQTYATGTRLLALLVFPACLGLAALLPELLPMLYGRAFAPAIPAAIMLIMAACTSAVGAIGSNLIWAMGKTDIDFYFGLAGAAVSLCIGLPLIMHFGLFGAVASRILTQTTVVGLGAWYIVHTLGFRLPWQSLLKLMLSAILCAAAARASLVFVHGLAGVCLATAVGAACYLRAVAMLRALTPDDLTILGRMLRHLPRPFGPATQRLLVFALG